MRIHNKYYQSIISNNGMASYKFWYKYSYKEHSNVTAILISDIQRK